MARHQPGLMPVARKNKNRRNKQAIQAGLLLTRYRIGRVKAG